MKIGSFSLYLCAIAILVIWWGLAFRTDPNYATTHQTQHDSTNSIEAFSCLKIKREDLKEALAGNFTLMALLVASWDAEAQYMQQMGIDGIQRLPLSTILSSQLAAKELSRKRTSNEKRFLPQTYVAASFLLALAEPQQIVALPNGFRQQEALYDPQITSQISLDIDRHHSETLYLQKPELAFVASYSHPSTVEALRNQGIQLFTIGALDTFQDICNVLTQIGNVTDRVAEAQLLRIFMEGAMLAIDNEIAFRKRENPVPKSLYVSYHSAFSLPTKKNLTAQLLIRLGVMEYMEELEAYTSQNQWSVPIDQEKIVNFKPDCLIISSDNAEGLKRRIDSESTFNGLRNTCQRIAYVNEDIVNSPTQYIVLAYYDLVQAVFTQ